jgi:hypothetical protein
LQFFTCGIAVAAERDCLEGFLWHFWMADGDRTIQGKAAVLAEERASLEQAKQAGVMDEAKIQGVETNIAWLENLLRQTSRDRY